MSEKTSSAPKAPSKFVQKLNSMKPSAMDDEKRVTVVNRLKMSVAFTAGALTTATIAATALYFKTVNANAEIAEGEETTED